MPVLLLTLFVQQSLTSQTARAQDSDTLETLQVNTSAEVLRVPSRFNLDFDSESGGTPAYFSFDSFFPFHQQPGNSLFYFSPRIRFDFEDENTFGGNVLVGYRTYSAGRDRILGGYLAIDARDTGESVFPQIGFGFERLGKFDIRANGYVPIGDTNQVTDSSTSETGTILTDAFFQGNQLILEGQNTITTITEREVALGGFDVEAGGTIIRFNDDGRLGIYGGVYYLAGDNVSAIGGRGRLELQPVKRVRLGVGVQGDGVFDTRVFFNASVQLPNPTELSSPDEEQQKIIDEAGDVVVRLGEPVFRTNNIVVDEQQDIDVEVIDFTGPAINPATGDPFFFTFVATGGMSAGTFEDPFGTVQEGLDATLGNGNDIVLVSVAPGGPGPIPAFTIPDNVTVLSDGFFHVVDVDGVGPVLLPGTGTGVLPVIDGFVTQGTNTVLAGFIELDVQTIGNASVLNLPATSADFGDFAISLSNSGIAGGAPLAVPALVAPLPFGGTPALDSEIEDFLGLEAGSLDDLNAFTLPPIPGLEDFAAIEGSAALVTLKISAPVTEAVQFDFNFLTDEAPNVFDGPCVGPCIAFIEPI